MTITLIKIIPFLNFFVKGFLKIFFVTYYKNEYIIKSDNSDSIYTLNVLDFVCDLANIRRKELAGFINLNEGFFKPFNLATKEEVYKSLSELCRLGTAFIFSELFPEKENADLILKIAQICHMSSNAFVKMHRDAFTQKNIDLLNTHIPSPHSELSYTFINDTSCETHKFNNIEFLLYYDLSKAYEIFATGKPIQIKVCENPECNRYFVVKGRSDKIYCDYPSPQNPKFPCNDRRLIQFYGVTDVEIEAKKLSHSIYVKLQQSPTKKTDDGVNYALEHFKKRNSEKKIAIENGTITLTEYYEWLKQYCY
jgi:hypothetical protein